MEDKDYIAFEDYRSGTLNADEKTLFEARLKDDAVFKAEFELFQEMSDHLSHHIGSEDATADFKTNLETISNRFFQEKDLVSDKKSTPKYSWFYRLGVAASVVILIGFFIFNNFNTPSYSDYNNFDPVSLSVRSGNTLHIKAEDAFNSKNYTEAIVLFNKLLVDNPGNLELQLYKSLALLETNQFTEADSLLNKISETNSAYKNSAKWYLALSKLKQERVDECITVLKTIPEIAENYEDAQKLIRKLE